MVGSGTSWVGTGHTGAAAQTAQRPHLAEALANLRKVSAVGFSSVAVRPLHASLGRQSAARSLKKVASIRAGVDQGND